MQVILSQLRQLRVDELHRLAKDKDPRVRAATAGALADLAQPAVPHLVAYREDVPWKKRVLQAKRLGITWDDRKQRFVAQDRSR